MKNGNANDTETDIKFANPFEVLQPRPERMRLLLFAGMDGAGKSTLACLTAWYMAEVGYRTLLLTTDSAPYIGGILGSEPDHDLRPVAAVPRLWTARVDRKEATRAYREKILADASGKVETDSLAQREHDQLCTEELATLDRFSDFVIGSDFDVVIFDISPTGHMLRLLEFPSNCAKQVEMMIGSREGSAAEKRPRRRFDFLLSQFKDPGMALFIMVVWPEETALVEARRAFLELRAADLPIGLVIVNQLLKDTSHADTSYESLRQMQKRCLAEIVHRFQCPLAAMPHLSEKIKGPESLKEAAEYFFVWGAADMRDA